LYSDSLVLFRYNSFMKRIIYLTIILIINLYATDTKEYTALNVLMTKIGITALSKNINQNTNDIQKLKEDIKYLLQQDIKNKLVIKDDKPSIVLKDDKQNKIEQLENEIKKLKKHIKNLTNTKQKSSILEAIVIHQKASIKNIPYQNGKIVRYVYWHDILEIQSCDKYGWCKLKDRNEYIPKYKLKMEN